MEDVDDEVLFAGRVAGLDIGKAGLMAAVRVPGEAAGRRGQEVREFAGTRPELESLADWLAGHQVTKVGMEATSDYWKPVFFTLEARGFDCALYNSAQVKALPGRPKTDPLTELREGVPQVSGRMGILVATVADHDHRRRCAA